jgi:site-specific DNA-methyltransferase (adenine-specific)
MLIKEQTMIEDKLIKSDKLYKLITLTDPFLGSHNVNTPKELVIDILDKINLSNKSVLVMFNVEFVISLVYNYNVDPKSITFYSDHDRKTAIATALKVRTITKLEDNMRFDIAVGNPPYQNGENATFYKNFIKISKDLADEVAFVVPSTHFNDVNEFKNLSNYKYCGNLFKGVQLVVTWFIWKKNYTGPCNIHTTTGIVPINDVLFAPTQGAKDLMLINKIINKKLPSLNKYYNGKLLRKDAIPDQTGIWCIWSAGYTGKDFDRELISKSQLPMVSGYGKHKVVFSQMHTPTTIGPIKYGAPDHACAVAARYFEVSNQAEANNLISYLETKFVKFMVWATKGISANNSQRMFQRIPAVDITRAWSNTDVYKHFGLTQPEIDHIENTIK